MLRALLLLGVSVAATSLPPQLAANLSDKLGFSPDQLARVGAEVVVAEVEDEAHPSRLTVAGVVRIGAPPARVAEELSGGAALVANDAVTLGGAFSDPPVAADLAAYRLPESDLHALRECRVGSCKLKLDAPAIAAFAALDWSAGDARQQADAIARQRLLGLAQSYLREGSEGLAVYADKEEPISVSQGLGQLLDRSDRVRRYASELDAHLRGFPHSTLDRAENHLRWSVQETGRRPVTDLVHSVVYRPADAPVLLMVEKQLFASHYFLARLELVALVPDAGDPASPGTFLVYVDRSQFDGDLDFFSRSVLVRGVLNQVRARLEAVRDRHT